MSPEFPNSYDTTPQGKETVDTAPKVKTTPETTDTKEEDKDKKLLNSLKTKFPGLESLFPSKSNELLSQLKTSEAQNLL